jgi:hypothetical protein
LPIKTSAARRHHIPRQKHQVANWAVYDADLRARGSLTAWVTPEAVAAGRPSRAPARAGSPRIRPSIAKALMLRAVFRPALLQTGGWSAPSCSCSAST